MTYKLAYIIIVVVVAINDTINAQNNISPFIVIMHELSPIKKEKKRKSGCEKKPHKTITNKNNNYYRIKKLFFFFEKQIKKLKWKQ